MNKTEQEIVKRLHHILDSATEDYGPEGLTLAGIAVLLRQQPPDLMLMLKEFQTKFQETYDGAPRCLPEALKYRPKFMKEELDEYNAAVKSEDLVKQYDALIDIVYLALGTLYLQGLPFYPGFNAIHESNMTKTCGKPEARYGTLVNKGAEYVSPEFDLKEIVESITHL